MSGHNKWSKIKHKKALTDSKKSKLFSKLVHYIGVEARLAKGDLNAPGLRTAIEKAKNINMPSENIERAIRKASEPLSQLNSIIYETYGPGGVGIIIETLTDSKNRTAQDIKHILSKNGFVLAGIGSVSWIFVKENSPEGLVWKPTTTISLSGNDLETLEKLIDELEENDDVQDVYTNVE